MKMCKYLVVLSCLLVSCYGTDEMAEAASDGEVRNAVARIEPFVFDGSETRTDLTYKDNVIKFSWDDDETIGVFPISPYQGSQAYKHLERSEDDGHVATFDGGGWKIRPNATYASYYPYNGKLTSDATFDKIPVSLKRQVQDGYNSLAHIGKNYDYMCATATAPSEGDIEFNFKHITSIVQLEVTLPESGIISNVIIFDKQHEQVFVDSAMLNVNTREVTPVHKSSMVELDVKNGTEVKANDKVLFYVAMLPMESRPIDITIEMQDGKCYEATYTPKDMKAGYAYRWSIVPEYAGEHVGVDLGLPSGLKWATMNVGAKSPSECGNYYAWGETLPQPDNTYDWSSYKWCNGTETSMTKYCINSSNGIVDNKTVLDPEDDAATQNWGSTWRMPTQNELNELIYNCFWTWTSNYNNTNMAGFVVYKAKSISDRGVWWLYNFPNPPIQNEYSLLDTHIFIPTAGVYYMALLSDIGKRGSYWTATLAESRFPSSASCNLVIMRDHISYMFAQRFIGFTIRAVCK